jgi:hypothetical protein
LHQTTFEPIDFYSKPCFVIAYLGANIKKLLKQKVAQNVTISFGYFFLAKK